MHWASPPPGAKNCASAASSERHALAPDALRV